MTVSFESSPCPTLAELAQFAAGSDDSLRVHVEHCRRCRALVKGMTAAPGPDSAETGGNFEPLSYSGPLPQRSVPAAESFGELCVAATEDAPGTLLVCAVLDWRPGSYPRTVEVAPISPDVDLASDHDLLLDAGSPLGYPAIVEVWNHGTLLASQIDERLGPLPDESRYALDALYGALLGTADYPALKTISRGVPIESDEDPRAAFQDAEAERAASFWMPAARLYSESEAQVQTVGSLLSEWLHREGRDPVGYAAELGWPTNDVIVLSEGTFEPTSFGPDRVGLALAMTRASKEEFEASIRRTVRVEHFAHGEPGTQQPMVFARPAGRKRLTGRRRTPSGATRKAPAELLEDYVQQALASFERARRR
jgi:hypothetical protein